MGFSRKKDLDFESLHSEKHVCCANLVPRYFVGGEVHRRKFCWAVKWQGGDFLEEAEGEDQRTLMKRRWTVSE